MYKSLTLLLLASLTACGAEAPDDGAEEAAAETVTGKSDSLFGEIVFGRFENPSPQQGTLASLELTEAQSSELPGRHFEGRYTLEEKLDNGDVRRSEGAFNVYRYARVNWIRFVDDDGRSGTSEDKYAWSVDDDTMRFEGVSGRTFELIAAAPSVEYDCGHGVSETELLPYDATDPYDRTAAELLATLTLQNLATAPSGAVTIATFAAEFEGLSLEEYVGSFDDETVNVYELSWYSVGYEMVSGYRGDNSSGIIFDAGFNEPVGLISDDDIMGCRNGECDWSIRVTSFPDSSTAFHADPLATELDFVDGPAKFTELREAQLRAMLAVTASWEDHAASTQEELLDATDDGGFWYYEMGDTVHWLKYYAGDTEVGAFFEKGTTNLIGTVGDGEISACMVAE